MPSSNRPSPRAATEDDGADSPAADGLRATPPRPNKRSSRAKSSSRRRRRSPNPNPRPRPDYYGTEPSRKSERKRKPRSFPDAALLSRALLPRASPSRAAGGAVQLWTDADELALLSGAVAFRAGSGRAPRLPDTGPLFESIRDSLSPHIDQSKVYYKLKRLKSKFCNTALSATSTAHDRRVRELSAAIWAADLAPPPPPPPALALEEAHHAEDDDDDDPEDDDEGYAPTNVAVGPRMPLVSDLLGEYWKRNARSLSGVSLEKGLALVGADEGRVVEAKWRRQLDAEMRSQVRRHDLAKEVFALLIDTVKGLGP
ncbi:STOREKEEPER protein-like [Lolium rigidum]|uniref:STOREKEEPER protein-like n=1 Tax=Lolium rigidum TaxID=89674 RepID=UPI001F5DF87B|nr:STOREKEEPER protein-like [Lolium rigidum]XP_047071417.1 STOREKEEPER protein-like [Lolium rigidum]